MKKFVLALCLIVPFAVSAGTGTQATGEPHAAARQSIKHGKFLVGYGGCQDCHTPGWAAHGGHAPKALLLTGGGMNFQGPWGTTYPANLRLLVQQLTVKQWIARLRSLKTRPAMPWWTFRYLSDKDLADMYLYIHSLGPAGKPAHAYVPPGKPAALPYFELKLPAKPRVATH